MRLMRMEFWPSKPCIRYARRKFYDLRDAWSGKKCIVYRSALSPAGPHEYHERYPALLDARPTESPFSTLFRWWWLLWFASFLNIYLLRGFCSRHLFPQSFIFLRISSCGSHLPLFNRKKRKPVKKCAPTIFEYVRRQGIRILIYRSSPVLTFSSTFSLAECAMKCSMEIYIFHSTKEANKKLNKTRKKNLDEVKRSHRTNERKYSTRLWAMFSRYLPSYSYSLTFFSVQFGMPLPDSQSESREHRFVLFSFCRWNAANWMRLLHPSLKRILCANHVRIRF